MPRCAWSAVGGQAPILSQRHRLRATVETVAKGSSVSARTGVFSPRDRDRRVVAMTTSGGLAIGTDMVPIQKQQAQPVSSASAYLHKVPVTERLPPDDCLTISVGSSAARDIAGASATNPVALSGEVNNPQAARPIYAVA